MEDFVLFDFICFNIIWVNITCFSNLFLFVNYTILISTFTQA